MSETQNQVHGLFLCGEFQGVTHNTSKENGEVKHYLNVLVNTSRSISNVRIKTKEPDKWEKVGKAFVKVPVYLYSPKDSEAVFYIEN